jgi:hypothetical protein
MYAACGGLFGLAYVAGELPNSWLKRRFGIAPGETRQGALGRVFLWVDQADSVVATLLVAILILPLDWFAFLFAVALLTLVHLALNALLRLVRVRKRL